MIYPISHNLYTAKIPVFRQSDGKVTSKTASDGFEMSVGYVNDTHGQVNNMVRILSGIRGDLKLSGGDNFIGDEKNRAVNSVIVSLMNVAGIKASAVGNHEFDTKQRDFVDNVSSYKGNFLAVNINQKPLAEQTPEEIDEHERADLNGTIKKSCIVDVKGEKIGLIGSAPVDFKLRITHPAYHSDCEIENIDKTAELIREEIHKLNEQGVNKIFLLSHLGYENDKEIAKKVSGIDVIIGGHTHELIKDIEEGKNLLYSPEGEPVIITEAGKNGNYFGELKLTFNSEGVITKAQNNLGETKEFKRNLINQYLVNTILGKPEVLGYVKAVLPPPDTLIEENPHANFMCDAMKAELDTDIAIWNNSGTRSYFQEGIIDSRDIKDIAPFEDRIAVANVSEKKIVEMFKRAVEDTYKGIGNKPGLLGVSGLSYVVDARDGKLAGMSFVDKDGGEHPIDINNPREDKFYKVVQDTFMMYEGVDYDALAPKEECIIYPYNKDFLACEYIKHLNRPIVINQSGRIKFINT